MEEAGARDLTGQRYWRSLEERAQTPEFRAAMHREFPVDASEMTSAFTRRAFMGLMGASAALAGVLTGCRRPEHKILPYARRPEELVPGVPLNFATSYEQSGGAVGLIVESAEGRPVKIEGHPEHPANLGAADMQTQAAILDLYDPERSRGPMRRMGEGSDARLDTLLPEAMEQQLDRLAARLAENGGTGFAFLSERTTSPMVLALRDDILSRFPGASWHIWEAVNDDNAIEGVAVALGRPLRMHVDYEHADVVVSLDGDFLGEGIESVGAARQFARRRRLELGNERMNRLYVVEGMWSLAGAKADHRLRLAPSRVADFTRLLASALGFGGAPAPEAAGIDEAFLAALAADMQAHSGRVAVVAGWQQPPAVHALAAWMNARLGAECVFYTELTDPNFPQALPTLRELVARMERGDVRTLVLIGGNPVFDAPADLAFGQALARVEETLHLSLAANETTLACKWHLPRAHQLESWGDTRSKTGQIALRQPLIAPLFGGLSDAELLSRLADRPARAGYPQLRAFYQGAIEEATFDPVWHRLVRDGLVPDTLFARVTGAAVDEAMLARAVTSAVSVEPAQGTIELVLVHSATLHDGRHANNGWLQETPDPLSKLTWDNAALVAPRTAERLGLTSQRLASVTVEGTRVSLPVFVLPGLAEDLIVAAFGHGRRVCGKVGKDVGHDVYPLRVVGGMYTRRARIEDAGGEYPLACVQDHWSMEGRPLIRSISEADYAAHPEAVEQLGPHVPPHLPLWEPPLKFETGPQWGMTIDLSTCIGCNACMVACQSENNVPIVGKEQVLNGREMHWLRIDRYFGGSEEAPEALFQPMACVHCENAPCEQVCPVAATTHSPEGINEMTYNRCVGTRYCSNNCPYKVRRFNFFNYTYGEGHEGPMPVGPIPAMKSNPDVTVRMRGVMEKCTYCVQRVNRSRIEARREGRPLREGEVVTACQQTCPTQAIVFGDITDEGGLVRMLKRQPRSYEVLEERNTQPRTSYLARLSNPNPALTPATEPEGAHHAAAQATPGPAKSNRELMA